MYTRYVQYLVDLHAALKNYVEGASARSVAVLRCERALMIRDGDDVAHISRRDAVASDQDARVDRYGALHARDRVVAAAGVFDRGRPRVDRRSSTVRACAQPLE